MSQKKKLQVFVSSTFEDLKEERQAAVEAILRAGHIPAGMELFTAGDQSQMNVIKRWIDESDVYLLILASRYGSIETISGLSYTHLEYNYAVDSGKPHFAVVINESAIDARVRNLGPSIFEQNEPIKLRDFRRLVTSKMVRFWSDTKDIKLAIMETLGEFASRDELVGWVKGSEAINAGPLAEEIVKLTRENADLRLAIENYRSATPSVIETSSFNGLTFEEMLQLLRGQSIELSHHPEIQGKLEGLRAIFEDENVNALHFFWLVRDAIFQISKEFAKDKSSDSGEVISMLEFLDRLGLVRSHTASSNSTIYNRYHISEAGKQFLLKLEVRLGNYSSSARLIVA